MAAVAGASEDVTSGSFSARANGDASAVVLSGLSSSGPSPPHVIPPDIADEEPEESGHKVKSFATCRATK